MMDESTTTTTSTRDSSQSSSARTSSPTPQPQRQEEPEPSRSATTAVLLGAGTRTSTRATTTTTSSQRTRSCSSRTAPTSRRRSATSNSSPEHPAAKPSKRPRIVASRINSLKTVVEDEGNHNSSGCPGSTAATSTTTATSQKATRRFQQQPPHDAAWNCKFELLKAYQRKHGHCRVPFTFVDEATSVRLGLWVSNQRKLLHHNNVVVVTKQQQQQQHAGQVDDKEEAPPAGPTTMAQERIQKLDSIGFQWRAAAAAHPNQNNNKFADAAWQHKFDLLCAYQHEHGHTRIPRTYVVNSIKLGAWADKNRVCYRNQTKLGKTKFGAASMTPERMAQLEAIGFEWIIKEPTADRDMWHQKYNLLSAFQLQHGHCRVPKSMVVDSVQLGEWVVHQRCYYKNYQNGKTGHGASITEERIALLNAIGFEWVLREPNANEEAWQHKFALLCDFQRANGHCNVPQGYVMDSVKLGEWVSHQRRFYKKVRAGQKGRGASITEERISQLESIGFSWAIDRLTWETNFELLSSYQAEHGHCRVAQSYTVDAVRLGNWVCRQRQYYRNYMEGKRGTRASINEDRIERLNSIGFEWAG